jgi:hypothetical protein
MVLIKTTRPIMERVHVTPLAPPNTGERALWIETITPETIQ